MDEGINMASTTRTLAPTDGNRIVGALNGVVTKTDVIVEAMSSSQHPGQKLRVASPNE